jgi:hypothetical protein
VFKVVRAVLEKFGAGSVSWGGLTTSQAVRSQRGGLTAQGMRSNRRGQCEQHLLLVAFPCCITALVQEEYVLAQVGACICAGGRSLCCSSIGLVVCALCLSMVLFGVDVKSAPHAEHTASRISWLNTCGRIRCVPVNSP